MRKGKIYRCFGLLMEVAKTNYAASAVRSEQISEIPIVEGTEKTAKLDYGDDRWPRLELQDGG
jgi:hypothetical protein